MITAETERILPPMNGFDSPTVLWAFVAAQIVGIAIAWLARLSEGSACQKISQYLFFGVLLVMGVVTTFALAVGPGCWVACATTLAVMVLTVTCDFRSSREAATW